jgi:hypothetical protein
VSRLIRNVPWGFRLTIVPGSLLFERPEAHVPPGVIHGRDMPFLRYNGLRLFGGLLPLLR